MKIDKLILGDFKTNCYVVSHDRTAFIIDPAFDGETINNFLISRGLKLKAIFLTHGHPDHIGAVDYLFRKNSCPIFAHAKERDMIAGLDPEKTINLPSFKGIKVSAPVQYFEEEFKSFNIDGIILDAIFTPGHSAGSVSYVLRNYKRIFSGDTVMKDTVGSLDFPTADSVQLRNSINLYKDFSDDCKIHPGHGDSTSISYEKTYNKYFKN